ncbi:hypothetical protein [Mariniblastus fucicola]|uniref:Uncharacterized protein n=1 Tax=Mariniblastus fucicola TaxID=980251 RepID=A0A5B9P4K2_9BACT|nr:hypothetical protein [Mariniblastus fucicola]QEG21527.1 hypothetical protein MFFC18_13830 [Mariniblastus fucicola]
MNFEVFFEVFEPIIGFSQNVKNIALLLGLGSVAGGIVSLFAHKRQLDDIFEAPHTASELQFESRKYRRRAIASSLIASQGIMLAGISFVDELRTLAIFISIILLMLVGILGIAMFDFFSVGINEIARKDDKARKALVDEYVRQRNKLAQQKEENEEPPGGE